MFHSIVKCADFDGRENTRAGGAGWGRGVGRGWILCVPAKCSHYVKTPV
jgi:hypothetical protein